MAFGFGANESKSSSESQSYGYSGGVNYGQSYLSPEMLAAYQNNLGGFDQAMANYQNPAIQQGLFQGGYRQDMWNRNLTQDAMGAGQGNLASQQQLAALAGGGTGPAANAQNYAARAGFAGTQNLRNDFANPNNALVQQQVGLLAEDLGRQYSEQMRPAIGNAAQQAGQRGSSRQGIAEGLAFQGVQDSLARGATGLYANAYGQAQQANQFLAQQGNALGLGMQQNQLQAANALQQGQLAGMGLGFEGVGQNSDLMRRGIENNFLPFQFGAGIIGSPATLNTNFGMNFGESTSSSKSSGKSQGGSFGF